jgi:hypothetical protein
VDHYIVAFPTPAGVEIDFEAKFGALPTAAILARHDRNRNGILDPDEILDYIERVQSVYQERIDVQFVHNGRRTVVAPRFPYAAMARNTQSHVGKCIDNMDSLRIRWRLIAPWPADLASGPPQPVGVNQIRIGLTRCLTGKAAAAVSAEESAAEEAHSHWGFFRHSHAPARLSGAREPSAMRDAVAIGATGGLVPCPAAIVTLLLLWSVAGRILALLCLISFSLVSENNVQQPTRRRLRLWRGTARNIQYPRQIHKNLVGWKFLVGYWIFSPPKNLMEPAKSRGPPEYRSASPWQPHPVMRRLRIASGRRLGARRPMPERIGDLVQIHARAAAGAARTLVENSPNRLGESRPNAGRQFLATGHGNHASYRRIAHGRNGLTTAGHDFQRYAGRSAQP